MLRQVPQQIPVDIAKGPSRGTDPCQRSHITNPSFLGILEQSRRSAPTDGIAQIEITEVSSESLRSWHIVAIIRQGAFPCIDGEPQSQKWLRNG